MNYKYKYDEWIVSLLRWCHGDNTELCKCNIEHKGQSEEIKFQRTIKILHL